jgi:hypothetical protein
MRAQELADPQVPKSYCCSIPGISRTGRYWARSLLGSRNPGLSLGEAGVARIAGCEGPAARVAGAALFDTQPVPGRQPNGVVLNDRLIIDRCRTFQKLPSVRAMVCEKLGKATRGGRFRGNAPFP